MHACCATREGQAVQAGSEQMLVPESSRDLCTSKAECDQNVNRLRHKGGQHSLVQHTQESTHSTRMTR